MEKKGVEELTNYKELYKDLIEILVRNGVIHQEFVLNRFIEEKRKQRSGFYDPEDNKIFIDTKQCLRSKREAIIHESRHANYSLKGKEDTEKQVEKETKIIYNSIYWNK